MSGLLRFTDGPARNALNAPKQASSHYDKHTSQSWARDAPKNFADARQKRWQDKTYQLKDFHNEVKRAMITCLTSKQGSLLDLACGRGGDMRKWFDASLASVHGVDISIEEISTARKRLLDLKTQKRRDIPYTFEVRADLGTAAVTWSKQYQAVACMFAVHYFFATEATIKVFMGNVAAALEDGGNFFGTVPSGKHVLQILRGRDAYKSSLLAISRTWPGKFEKFTSFGSGYKFALVKTVTNDSFTADEAGEGCEEYLVFMGAFTQIAELFHLYPDPAQSWNFYTRKNRGEEAFFKPGPVDGKHRAFRTFNPRYDPKNPDSEELGKISRLNAAFVFKKDERRQCSPGCMLHPDHGAPAQPVKPQPHEPDDAGRAAAAAVSPPSPSEAAPLPFSGHDGPTEDDDWDDVDFATMGSAAPAAEAKFGGDESCVDEDSQAAKRLRMD